MEVWLAPHLGFDYERGSARIYGSGEGAVNYISGLDVADFAVANALAPPTQSEIVESGFARSMITPLERPHDGRHHLAAHPPGA